MNEDTQKLLRAMLAARRAYEAATAAQNEAWEGYLSAQASFLGKFSSSSYPVGPFAVGDVLIEHEEPNLKWPPTTTAFSFSPVIRCPTSE